MAQRARQNRILSFPTMMSAVTKLLGTSKSSPNLRNTAKRDNCELTKRPKTPKPTSTIERSRAAGPPTKRANIERVKYTPHKKMYKVHRNNVYSKALQPGFPFFSRSSPGHISSHARRLHRRVRFSASNPARIAHDAQQVLCILSHVHGRTLRAKFGQPKAHLSL